MVIAPAAPVSPLITELKREHEAIMQAMNDLKRDIGNPDQVGRSLGRARDLLLAHLQKEDDQLYGVLNAKARDDATLARTLNVFAADMQEISRTAVAFFTAVGKKPVAAEHLHDFGKLFGILGNRIRREEIILYPAYDTALMKRPASQIPADRGPANRA